LPVVSEMVTRQKGRFRSVGSRSMGTVKTNLPLGDVEGVR